MVGIHLDLSLMSVAKRKCCLKHHQTTFLYFIVKFNFVLFFFLLVLKHCHMHSKRYFKKYFKNSSNLRWWSRESGRMLESFSRYQNIFYTWRITEIKQKSHEPFQPHSMDVNWWWMAFRLSFVFLSFLPRVKGKNFWKKNVNLIGGLTMRNVQLETRDFNFTDMAFCHLNDYESWIWICWVWASKGNCHGHCGRMTL